MISHQKSTKDLYIAEIQFEEVESCGFCKHIKFTGISNIIDCEHKPEKFSTNSKCEKFEWKIAR